MIERFWGHIARDAVLEDPVTESYIAKLREACRLYSVRLVEGDLANWKFEMTQPEEGPEPRPGYQFVVVEGEIRIANERALPGHVSEIHKLPTQRVFVPWHYVVPYARGGARVLWRKVTSAGFEFSQEGGKVGFAGHELEVPPGAVPNGTRITLRYPYVDKAHPRTANVLHRLKVEVEPSVTFSKPVALRLASTALRGAGRVLQAHIARRGAKFTGSGGVAAILPRGPAVWTFGSKPGAAYGCDPTRGVRIEASKPERGWVEVPTEGSSANPGWEKDIAQYVGGRRLVPPKTAGGHVFVPSDELRSALQAVLDKEPQVVVQFAADEELGRGQPRKVNLLDALSRSEAVGEFRELAFTRSFETHSWVTPHGQVVTELVTAYDGPPYVHGTLACRAASPAGELTVTLVLSLRQMPLECLLYQVGGLSVVTDISWPISGPGVYSVIVEGDEAVDPTAKK